MDEEATGEKKTERGGIRAGFPISSHRASGASGRLSFVSFREDLPKTNKCERRIKMRD